MSSNTEDTNFLTDKIVYDSSEWKPLTFTHVEYPKGKIILAIQITAIEMSEIPKIEQTIKICLHCANISVTYYHVSIHSQCLYVSNFNVSVMLQMI